MERKRGRDGKEKKKQYKVIKSRKKKQTSLVDVNWKTKSLKGKVKNKIEMSIRRILKTL